ncbi:unnamed protein product [Caenorhabditis sp. 36 PRJEB53466]|nr:unnamed protein product [Caenorhabditis sp. 36 PRJEB53466]
MFKRLTKQSTPQMATPPQISPAAEKQKQERIRADLQKELDNVVKAAIASPHSRRDNVPSEITQNLCNSIEAIFIHGLRDPFFLKGTRYAKYPEPNFWPFVSKFSPHVTLHQIACLGQIRTEIGKGRAWIRIILNENVLGQYMDQLAAETNAIQQFYNEDAFLRLLADPDHSARICGLLKPLTSLPISAATNSSFLNTWTPTPLILAGLMTGEPLKVGVLKARPNPKPAHMTEEIAIPAIDALVPEEYQDIGSPAYLERKRRRALGRPIRRRSENEDNSDNSSVYSHPSMLDSGEMSYQHAVLGSLRRNASSSGSRIQLMPQSPLFASTPIDTAILDPAVTANINKRSSDFVQVVSDIGPDDPPGYQPLIISRRIRRPSKQYSGSRSSSESASRDSRRRAGTRDSRANSDMPSTIFGTVPNDVAFSLDDPIVSKPISATMDSGIAEMISSVPTRTASEVESESTPVEETKTERSVSFLEALTELASVSVEEEEIPAPRSLSLTDAFLKNQEQEQRESEEFNDVENTIRQTKDDEEVFDVSMDEEEGTSTAPAPTSSFRRSDPVSIPGRRRIIERLEQKTDTILGTSLRDELMDALPAAESATFEQGIPIYVQSPVLMGNSLAAIGARHNMWESNSDRSRLSSSSDSGGPVVSFGQALRSAMEHGRAVDEADGVNSLGTSSQDLNVDDGVVEDVESTTESRKLSTVTQETTDKLCNIAREKGLDSQDFRCAMCRKTVGGSTFSKFETCGIDGKYYCTECMKPGGKVSIPARVVMDWDWRERAVSDRGRAWYEANQEKALINVKERNPRLYSHVPALEETRKLREKLHLVSMYLFTCRESVAEDFRRRLWPKEYLRSDVDLYSFADLMDVKSGAMQRRLNHLLKHSMNHVMACTLCRQKGFCCEMCSVSEVIYPFNTESTHRCRVCFTVFHVQCWRTAAECPKCIRRREFETRRAQIDDPHNSLLILQP